MILPQRVYSDLFENIHPFRHIPKKSMLCGGGTNEFCPICGAPVSSEGVFVNRLKDETIVCEKCAAKTRFLYPVKSGTRMESERKYHRHGMLSGGSTTNTMSIGRSSILWKK